MFCCSGLQQKELGIEPFLDNNLRELQKLNSHFLICTLFRYAGATTSFHGKPGPKDFCSKRWRGKTTASCKLIQQTLRLLYYFEADEFSFSIGRINRTAAANLCPAKPKLLSVLTIWIVCELAFPEQHAGIALSALIRALDELKMVAVVRYAYNRSSNPQVGAAFPFIKKNYEVSFYTHWTFRWSLWPVSKSSEVTSPLLPPSVSCTSSCPSQKTSGSSPFPLLKTTKRSRRQVHPFSLWAWKVNFGNF